MCWKNHWMLDNLYKTNVFQLKKQNVLIFNGEEIIKIILST